MVEASTYSEKDRVSFNLPILSFDPLKASRRDYRDVDWSTAHGWADRKPGMTDRDVYQVYS